MSEEGFDISPGSLHRGSFLAMQGAADAIQRIIDTLSAGNAFNVRVTDSTLMPFIQPGDLMVFKSTNYVKTREGDFVLYRLNSGVPAVRRVVRKLFVEGKATLITRSDVDHNERDQLRASQLLAKLVHVERHGRKISAWRLNRGPIDWLTSYGTRPVWSKFVDFVLFMLPLHKRREDNLEVGDDVTKIEAPVLVRKSKKKGSRFKT